MTKRFQKPTPEEVEVYAAEIGFKIDGQAFCDRYDAVGWVYGTARTPIKDWKAVVRTWKRNSAAWNNGQPVKPGADVREKYLREAIQKTRTIRTYISFGYDYESTEPKEYLTRYWRGLADKHGQKFMDDLKERLKANV
jgi:hypothetical protein